MKKQKWQTIGDALDFARSKGASLKDGVLYVHSGAFGLKTIGVVDFLSRQYTIRWI